MLLQSQFKQSERQTVKSQTQAVTAVNNRSISSISSSCSTGLVVETAVVAASVVTGKISHDKMGYFTDPRKIGILPILCNLCILPILPVFYVFYRYLTYFTGACYDTFKSTKTRRGQHKTD